LTFSVGKLTERNAHVKCLPIIACLIASTKIFTDGQLDILMMHILLRCTFDVEDATTLSWSSAAVSE